MRVIRNRYIKRYRVNPQIRTRVRLIHLVIRMKLRNRPPINRNILPRLIVTTRPANRFAFNTMHRVNSPTHSSRTNRQYGTQNMMITYTPIKINLSHYSLSILNHSLVNHHKYTNHRSRHTPSPLKVLRRPLRNPRPTRKSPRSHHRTLSSRNINRNRFSNRLITSNSPQPT